MTTRQRHCQTISKNLRRLRREADLTQEELAEKANLSHGCIKFIETCRRMPQPYTLDALATALNCSVDDLERPSQESPLNREIANKISRAVRDVVEKILLES